MIAFNASSSTATTAPAAATARAGLSLGRRTLGLGLAATVLAAGAYAYTAQNTVEASRAGDGAAVISGYDVTGVEYTLNATDPSVIDAVSFTTDAAATTVKAKVVSAETAYADCTSGDGTTWSCDLTATSPAVGAADQLTVIATS